MGHRVFVLEIRPETNEVVVGENEEVFADGLKASRVSYMAIPPLEIGESSPALQRYDMDTKARPVL